MMIGSNLLAIFFKDEFDLQSFISILISYKEK